MAGKMQDFKFQNVVEMLDVLPENEKQIMMILRDLIISTLSDSSEKLSYNVPFYVGKKRIAFIWPGSIPWGSKTFEGVQLGICKGYRIDDPQNYFTLGNRKEVTTRTFKTIEEIDLTYIEFILIKARELDAM
ncbi:DUF1801 domain-containing protein [bacterium]|nr:DUF1801 domain-containing protein [bacterium]